jgi:hypothetical protein
MTRGAIIAILTGAITEQVDVANIGLQHVHRLVPRHVPHLEYARTPASRTRQEAGT